MDDERGLERGSGSDTEGQRECFPITLSERERAIVQGSYVHIFELKARSCPKKHATKLFSFLIEVCSEESKG